jgi:glycine betaine/proline transport system ATP-binding protein
VVHDDRLAHLETTGAASIARDELTSDYLTTEADRPLIDILQQVGRHQVPLGVLDEDGRLIGVAPRATVLAALATPGRS